MQNQQDPEMKMEMDIADFSGKTVKRIDIRNVTLRADIHKVGIAVVMTFTDGSAGTILVSTKRGPVIIDPYARPRMAGYSIGEEADLVAEADLAVAP